MVVLARAELRLLIDTLEARYRSLPEDCETLQEDLSSYMQSEDTSAMHIAINVREDLIRSLYNVVHAAESDVSHLRANMNRVLNTKLPIASLPFEILSTIFQVACFPTKAPRLLFAIGENDSSEVRYGRDLRRTRSAISSTCTKWRDTALHTAALWSTIVLTRRGYPDNPSPMFSETACLSLGLDIERAHGHPLAIEIHSNYDLFEGVAHFMRSNLKRCSALHLTLSNRYTHSCIDLSGVFGDAPLLSGLRSLYLSSSEDSEHMVPQEIDLRQSQSLRDFWIYRNGDEQSADWSSSYIIHPPHTCNVARLHLQGHIQPLNAVALINACTQLELLDWEYEGGIIRTPPLLPFAHLRSLRLWGGLPVSRMHLMSAPLLEDLVVRGVYLMNPNDIAHPLKNVRLFPALRKLQIDVITPEDAEPAAAFIQAHPYLEEVELMQSALEEPFIRCMGNTGALPKLTCVRVAFPWHETDDYSENVRALLRLRAETSANAGSGSGQPKLTVYCDWRPIRQATDLGPAIPGAAELVDEFPDQVKVRGLHDAEFIREYIWSWDEENLAPRW